MTVAELADYLAQLPPDAAVYLTEDDVDRPGEFVILAAVLAAA
jgi:hypothetical protein